MLWPLVWVHSSSRSASIIVANYIASKNFSDAGSVSKKL